MPLDTITMGEGSWTTHEPDEWYPGELLRLEDGGDYGYGETIRFVIQLDGEEGETWALASQKMTPRTKLYGWVKAIDPDLVPDVGQPFKYAKLEGRRVEVMFELGDEREKVVKIRAEKKASALQKGQKAAAVAKKPVSVYRSDGGTRYEATPASTTAAKRPQDDDSPF